VRRREFIAGLGGAVAWPFARSLAVDAQHQVLPVIGFVDGSTLEARGGDVTAFHRGLADGGYVEGRNVAIEYHWVEDHYDRLPGVIAELIRRPVAMIAVAGNARHAVTAKAATQTIPIVFMIGADPLSIDLVTNLARPGANITGVTLFAGEVMSKRLELLHRLVPAAISIAWFRNPANYAGNAVLRELQVAARVLGVQLLILDAGSRCDIEDAFAALVQQRAGALLLGADPLFISQRDLLVTLAARHAIPTSYFRREFAEAGGLISYGASPADSFHTAGVYAGRILKGEKPGDLPVQQPTKIELVLNLKTAKALGLTVPTSLLAIADEVIE
jgi:putative tryptophan/tyrosine transport system substrate-binding protein